MERREIDHAVCRYVSQMCACVWVVRAFDCKGQSERETWWGQEKSNCFASLMSNLILCFSFTHPRNPNCTETQSTILLLLPVLIKCSQGPISLQTTTLNPPHCTQVSFKFRCGQWEVLGHGVPDNITEFLISFYFQIFICLFIKGLECSGKKVKKLLLQ